MTFLQKIHDINKERIALARKNISESALRDSPFFNREKINVKEIFKTPGIIAEIKFASPSEGIIHDNGDAVKVATGYLNAGAAMLSVLTEPLFFGGQPASLQNIRTAHPRAALLRKDFIVDEYQLLEAKAWGADAALIIAAMTEPKLTQDLFDAARALNLAALVEVHDEAELEQALALSADFIGVNNRDLKTLKINLDTGRRLASKKPANTVFICESGLATPRDVQDMRALGYDGFLMGTHFMRARDPGGALKKFMGEL